MIRATNPYVAGPEKMESFQGMRGKSNRALNVIDAEGDNISARFANLLQDLDPVKFTGLKLRPGKRKWDNTGFPADIDWVGELRMNHQTVLAFKYGGFLRIEGDWQLPEAAAFPEDRGYPAPGLGDQTDVGLPDLFAVSDGGNDCIVLTDPAFGTWLALGGNGSGAGQFNGPRHCWYDSASEYFYVADAGNNRVVKTKIDGTGWATTPATIGGKAVDYPYGCYYDAASDLCYFTNADTGTIMRWNFTASAGAVFSTMTGLPGGSPTTFDGPRGIFLSGTTLYIADGGTETTSTYPRVVSCPWGGAGASEIGGTVGSGEFEFNVPRSVWFDAATDFLYITDRDNNRIVRTKMDGSCWAELGGFDEPRGCFYDTVSRYIFTSDTAASVLRRRDIMGDGAINFGFWGDDYTTPGAFNGPRYVHPIWL